MEACVYVDVGGQRICLPEDVVFKASEVLTKQVEYGRKFDPKFKNVIKIEWPCKDTSREFFLTLKRGAKVVPNVRNVYELHRFSDFLNLFNGKMAAECVKTIRTSLQTYDQVRWNMKPLFLLNGINMKARLKPEFPEFEVMLFDTIGQRFESIIERFRTEAAKVLSMSDISRILSHPSFCIQKPKIIVDFLVDWILDQKLTNEQVMPLAKDFFSHIDYDIMSDLYLDTVASRLKVSSDFITSWEIADSRFDKECRNCILVIANQPRVNCKEVKVHSYDVISSNLKLLLFSNNEENPDSSVAINNDSIFVLGINRRIQRMDLYTREVEWSPTRVAGGHTNSTYIFHGGFLYQFGGKLNNVDCRQCFRIQEEALYRGENDIKEWESLEDAPVDVDDNKTSVLSVDSSHIIIMSRSFLVIYDVTSQSWLPTRYTPMKNCNDAEFNPPVITMVGDYLLSLFAGPSGLEVLPCLYNMLNDDWLMDPPSFKTLKQIQTKGMVSEMWMHNHQLVVVQQRKQLINGRLAVTTFDLRSKRFTSRISDNVHKVASRDSGPMVGRLVRHQVLDSAENDTVIRMLDH